MATSTHVDAASSAGSAQDRLNRLLNEGIKQLNGMGRSDLARSVSEEAQRGSQPRPTVVVAGESNRGKSTLINALLRRPDLAPTGPTATTGTFVRFHYAATPRAVVYVPASTGQPDSALKPEQREIPVEELGDWVSLEGAHLAQRPLLGAAVGVPSAVLKYVDLVDTPGVGGLESALGILALEAITKADAMIFVVDAGSPLSAPELEFLVHAGRRIDTIVIAVTKVDAYHGAQRIIDDNVALLGRYAPDLGKVTVLGVSPAMFLWTAKANREQHAAQLLRLRRESGIGALEVSVRQRIVERAGNLAFANTLQTLRHGLGVLLATAEAAQASASQADPAVAATLREERQRLAALDSDSAEWRQRLSSEIAKIRNEYQTELSRQFRTLSRRYEEQIERAKASERERIPERLEQDLIAVGGDLADMVSCRLADVATELLGTIDAGSSLDETLAELTTSLCAPSRATIEQRGRATLTRVEKLSSLVSFSSGRALGSLGATLPFTGGLGLPVVGVGLGVGALFSVVMTKARREAREQNNLRVWFKDVVVETQASLNSAFVDQMIDVQGELTKALSGYIAQRKQTATTVLKATEAAMSPKASGVQDRSGDDATRRALKQLMQDCRHFQALTGSDRVLSPSAGATPSNTATTNSRQAPPNNPERIAR